MIGIDVDELKEKHKLRLSQRNEHWMSVEDSDDEDGVPCKERMPGPPRPLNGIDKEKYGIQSFANENGLIKDHKQE